MKPSIRQLRNLLILVVGMFAASAAIHEFTPTPYLPDVTPKVTHLKENSETYDIVFVGSSRVFRQVSPRVFDQRLRIHDLDLSSFNAGVPAAKSVEVWHLLRNLGADQGVRTRYVLIEPDGLLVGIAKENVATEREIYWHGRTETALAIESLEGMAIVPRLRMSAFHSGAFLLDRFGVGRLRLLISQKGESRRLGWLDTAGLGPDGDGWVPFAKADTQSEFPRRQEFLDNLPLYRHLLARQAVRRSRPDCLTGYHRTMLANLTTAIETLGAKPVFFLSPATEPRCEVHQAFREGLLPNLLAFDDASKYPDLYAVEHRHDAEHLNTEGALLYSRVLADGFARLVRDDEGGEDG